MLSCISKTTLLYFQNIYHFYLMFFPKISESSIEFSLCMQRYAKHITIYVVLLPGTLPCLGSLMAPSEHKRPKQSGINFIVFLQNPRKVTDNSHRASRTPCMKNKSKVHSKRQISLSGNARFQVVGKGKA